MSVLCIKLPMVSSIHTFCSLNYSCHSYQISLECFFYADKIFRNSCKNLCKQYNIKFSALILLHLTLWKRKKCRKTDRRKIVVGWQGKRKGYLPFMSVSWVDIPERCAIRVSIVISSIRLYVRLSATQCLKRTSNKLLSVPIDCFSISSTEKSRKISFSSDRTRLG